MADSTKRIVAVGVGSTAEEQRVVLVLEAGATLVSRREGLEQREAELFAEGVIEGLKIADRGYSLQSAAPDAVPENWQLEADRIH